QGRPRERGALGEIPAVQELLRTQEKGRTRRPCFGSRQLQLLLMLLLALRARLLSLRAWPPLRPASRASSEVNSWAVPFSCAARPPSLAISRWRFGSIDAN